MKKFLTLILLMAIAMQNVTAQSMNSLIDKYKDKEKAEYVHVTPFMMKLAKVFMSKDDDVEMMKKIDSVYILDLEECSKEVKMQFAEDAGKGEFEGYDPLMTMNDDGDNVRIMMKSKGKKIHELVILAIDDDDSTLIRVKCNISRDDIQKLVDMETKDMKKKKSKKASSSKK